MSFASNVGAQPGRVVVIVTDMESMTAGYEKLVLDSASNLVDRLGPANAVGLLVLPGKSVDLTRDHQQVRQVLQQLRGFRSAGSAARLSFVRGSLTKGIVCVAS